MSYSTKLLVAMVTIVLICVSLIALLERPQCPGAEVTAEHNLAESSTSTNANEKAFEEEIVAASAEHESKLVGMPIDNLTISRIEEVAPSDDVTQIAEDFYGDVARTSFVFIDSKKFIERLRFSLAYQYTESGAGPAPYPPDGHVDFVLRLFDDSAYALTVTDVVLNEVNGSRYMIIKGNLLDGLGTFKIISTGEGKLMHGSIITEDHFTRFDTWKISPVTAVAQYPRAYLD